MPSKNEYAHSSFRGQFFFAILFLALPLSVAVEVGIHQINLPSELLIGLLAILLIWQIDFTLLKKNLFIRQPISLAAMAYLGWMLLMIPFSSAPGISFKYALVSLAHWWVFYIGFSQFCTTIGDDLFKNLRFYGLSFAIVIIYAWIIHAQYGFRVDISVMVARPFYRDHALYSTCMSLLVFYFASMAIWPPASSRKSIHRGISIFLTALFLLGIYWSFCRAAWLSLLGAIGFGCWIGIFRIRFSVLLFSLLVLGAISVIALPNVKLLLEENTVESKKGNWLDQIKSIGNITSDASNLERINRYSCAWRMFLDRPLTGFGAGTYPVAYLSYQRQEEMTRLSVTSPQRPEGPHYSGQGGSTHSEYLRALSELGFPGLLFWLALVGSTFFTGLKVYYHSKRQSHRRLAMALLLGLCTFFIHTLLNNFLHSDKVAILFWVMLAALAHLSASLNPSQMEASADPRQY